MAAAASRLLPRILLLCLPLLARAAACPHLWTLGDSTGDWEGREDSASCYRVFKREQRGYTHAECAAACASDPALPASLACIGSESEMRFIKEVDAYFTTVRLASRVVKYIFLRSSGS